MPVAYVIAGVVVVLLVGAAVVLVRRRSTETTDQVHIPAPPPASRPPANPMTGLEAALAQVTDREGRPIGDRIDAESELVDELRVPDDTGPLLRRALDRVEHIDSPESAVEGEPTGRSDAG